MSQESNLEINPSVLDQRNQEQIKDSTALNDYDIELFEEKTENINYKELGTSLFSNDEIIYNPNSNSLFKTKVEYSSFNKETQILKLLSYILIILVGLEVLYLSYKMLRKRRRNNVEIDFQNR